MKAVKFDHYGDIDVVEVRDVPRPSPGPGEVQVEVKAAGINPGEAMIRKGALHDRWPATFPSGLGSDLAGVVLKWALASRRSRSATRCSASHTYAQATRNSSSCLPIS
jgi:NADPH:quinone reductase-like Zn-dependent oxidoreductase